ncbi:MAG: YfbK domain-containing protein, partial [Myxococcota bacterium]
RVAGNAEMERLIEEKRKEGIFLTVLGFGMGNYKDSKMELLADKGNGNYAYIDTEGEARKVLVEQLSGTLVTIAKDVKIQVEFNPAHVSSYRLIGYNNRLLAAKDFNDDTKDAGEIGAGHTVTALYEIVPTAATTPENSGSIDPLKYQVKPKLTPAADSLELLNVKLRYKQPDGHTSKLLQFPVSDSHRSLDHASTDMKFAVAVASFGQRLRNNRAGGLLSYPTILTLARAGLGKDPFGYRAEFVGLVQTAASLAP